MDVSESVQFYVIKLLKILQFQLYYLFIYKTWIFELSYIRVYHFLVFHFPYKLTEVINQFYNFSKVFYGDVCSSNDRYWFQNGKKCRSTDFPALKIAVVDSLMDEFPTAWWRPVSDRGVDVWRTVQWMLKPPTEYMVRVNLITFFIILGRNLHTISY